MKRITQVVWLLAFVAGFGAFAVAPAAAQTSAGIRAGLSVDPDQFYFGGHVETPPLVDRLRFKPNVEIGIGNDITVVALNIEFAYVFPSRRAWNVYTGGGPALVIMDTREDTDSGGGFNLLVGAEHQSGLFTEIKVGFVDSPDFKIGVGYSFR
jgi:hypothetical protein